MTRDEMERRKRILDEMDAGAFECAGCLVALVATGRVTQPTALAAVKRFQDASTAYAMTDAIDRASGVPV